MCVLPSESAGNKGGRRFRANPRGGGVRGELFCILRHGTVRCSPPNTRSPLPPANSRALVNIGGFSCAHTLEAFESNWRATGEKKKERHAATQERAQAAMSIAPVSQFFILSPRGDTIISKDYRGDAVAGTTDTFFRKASGKRTSCLSEYYNVFAGGEKDAAVLQQRRTPRTTGTKHDNTNNARQVFSAR